MHGQTPEGTEFVVSVLCEPCCRPASVFQLGRLGNQENMKGRGLMVYLFLTWSPKESWCMRLSSGSADFFPPLITVEPVGNFHLSSLKVGETFQVAASEKMRSEGTEILKSLP